MPLHADRKYVDYLLTYLFDDVMPLRTDRKYAGYLLTYLLYDVMPLHADRKWVLIGRNKKLLAYNKAVGWGYDWTKNQS